MVSPTKHKSKSINSLTCMSCTTYLTILFIYYLFIYLDTNRGIWYVKLEQWVNTIMSTVNYKWYCHNVITVHIYIVSHIVTVNWHSCENVMQQCQWNCFENYHTFVIVSRNLVLWNWWSFEKFICFEGTECDFLFT